MSENFQGLEADVWWIDEEVDDCYVCIVHPSVERDLRNLVARENWKDAYRQARALGKANAHPREILAAYVPIIFPAEVGALLGVRIATQAEVAP